MKLSQITESFVISNDEFEDYLNRTTEQLAQELQSGKNARDAIHDLALQFSAQHNKAYEAYVRMSDALTARMHTLELDGSTSTEIAPADMTNGPEMSDMGADMGDMGSEPEMMTDPMGDMEMETPAQDEMPGDSDMEDYAAVMNNEPEVEESVNEAEERPYVCVHAKKGKHECTAASSYEAAQKAAKAWGLKSTAGIDAHLADVEKVATEGKYKSDAQRKAVHASKAEKANESIDAINKIVADKQHGKLHGMTIDMFTASAIKQVYDNVSDENKVKLDDLMTSKEGILKAANIAMKVMKEDKQIDEVLPAVAAVAGGVARAAAGAAGAAARGAGAMAKAAPKISKGLRTARRVGNAVNTVSNAVQGASDRANKSVNFAKKHLNNSVEAKADSIMSSSTRKSFSEYNEFYKALDGAAKSGKKAGDTIEVGGKKIKLKSNPKQMDQLSDAEMDKIDALADRLNEKRSCKK